MNSPCPPRSRLDDHPAICHPHPVLARLTFTLLVFLFSLPAWAADWNVEHLNRGDPVREFGPIPLRLRINNPTGKPVEGRIESIVTVDSKPLVHHVSQPVVLVPGPQVISHLLPHFPRSGTFRDTTLRFVTSDGSVPLGKHILAAFPNWRMIVAHVTARPEQPELLFTKQFEAQEKARLEDARTSLNTNVFRYAPLWLAPEDLPTLPIGLCAYDCLVLHPDSLGSLRPRQYAAIADWVDSGGRLLICVSTSPQLPSSARIDDLLSFLRCLSLDHPSKTWTESEPRGIAEVTDAPRMFASGCGRVVVISHPEALTETVAQIAVEFLYGIGEGTEKRPRPILYAPDEFEFAVPHSSIASLLPANARPLPAQQVIWYMLAFVALATAGDYFFLGWLRKRKYTWLLFPALAAGATTLMFIVAHRHMTSLTQRGELRVVDIGLDGRVLREFRISAMVTPRAMTMPIEGHAALMYPMERTSPVLMGWTSRQSSNLLGIPARIEGNIAADSRLIANFEQWSPQYFYSYTIGGKDDSGIRWSNYQPAAPLKFTELHPRQDRSTFVLVEYSVIPPNGEGRDATRSERELLAASTKGFIVTKPAPVSGLPPLISYDWFQRSRGSVVIAIRTDGQNITCYRKFQGSHFLPK